MTDYARNMAQEATYWPPGVSNGFGQREYTTPPVLITCRWQDDSVMFRDPQGREVMSSAVVYPDRELELFGLLALGDFTISGAGSSGAVDPVSAGAREVRQRSSSPSLSGDETLNKVYL